MKNIYLSGPIGGLTFDESISWCDWVKEELENFGITCWRPLRGKEFLRGSGEISATGGVYTNPLALPQGIMGRDFFDVNRADLIISNFLPAKRVSIGTVMEVAWAYQLRTPVIAIGGADDIHIAHPMMMMAITYRVDTVEEAVDIAKAVLLP